MTSASEIRKREEAAKDFFRKGYNCAQSVALAFSDIIGLDTEQTARVTAGLGGGVGRMREVCGAVSAMAVIAGGIAPFTEPSSMEDKKKNYALVQLLAGRFREEKGAIVCRELMKLRADAPSGPEPEARTEEYYRSRPCEGNIACAARILAQYLFNDTKL